MFSHVTFFSDASTRINLKGPPYLPGPVVATGVQIQCSGHPIASFQRELSSASKIQSASVSAAIRAGATQALATNEASSPHTQVRRRRPADAFLIKRKADVALEPMLCQVPVAEMDKALNSGPPLMSIGAHTNAIIDRFKLGDEILLKLRHLISTVRSSRWEENLRSPKWKLDFEQASKLTGALHADLQVATPVILRVSKVSNIAQVSN